MQAKPPLFEKLESFADEFVESAASLPNADSRNLVDSMTQAFSKLKDYRILLHPDDYEEDYSNYKSHIPELY